MSNKITGLAQVANKDNSAGFACCVACNVGVRDVTPCSFLRDIILTTNIVVTDAAPEINAHADAGSILPLLLSAFTMRLRDVAVDANHLQQVCCTTHLWDLGVAAVGAPVNVVQLVRAVSCYASGHTLPQFRNLKQTGRFLSQRA